MSMKIYFFESDQKTKINQILKSLKEHKISTVEADLQLNAIMDQIECIRQNWVLYDELCRRLTDKELIYFKVNKKLINQLKESYTIDTSIFEKINDSLKRNFCVLGLVSY